jgi:pyruvate dehydrogenase E1 component alpha subunit
VLFVCEDNGFAATTRTAAMTGGDGPAARARSIGIASAEVDGNDVLAVESAVTELLDAVRAGRGPRFLCARTYRLTGHTGADPATYRPKAEVEARWKEDPIARLGAHLRLAGVSDADLAADAAAAAAEMRRVYERAVATPYPAAGNAFADVQDVGDPRAGAL